MMYTLEQLKEMAQPYLEKNEAILATTDGQFFYNTSDGKIHAKNYAFRQKVKVYLISKNAILTEDQLKAKETADQAAQDEAEKKEAAKKAKEAEKALADAAKKAETGNKTKSTDNGNKKK